MSDEAPTTTAPEERENKVAERAAFNAIADTLERFSLEARLRVFRLLITHFELPLGERGVHVAHTAPGPMPQKGAASFSEDRSASPKQFLLEKKPTTDVERATCLAYYLTHYRATPFFKTLDISKLNTEAAQIKLSNPTSAVDNAATSGLLVQAGQGKKQLSALGELYVQALPDKAAARAAIADTRPRRRPKFRPSEKASKSNEQT